MKRIIYCLISICICSCKEALSIEQKEFELPIEVSFNEHIATLIHQNCTPCHRPGEAGPFPLINYKDVYRKHKTIAEVVGLKYMPPWPAEKGYGHFIGERILSEYEIALIKKWSETGAREGTGAGNLKMHEYPDGSALGKPDLVVKMEKPVFIKGNNIENFLLVKLPFELEQDTFIRCIEFVPGNRQLVHHVNVHLLVYEDGAKTDIFKGKRVLDPQLYGVPETYQLMDLANDDGSFPMMIPNVCAYLPGAVPALYPEGIGGIRAKKKSILFIRDIHYGPSALDTSDQSYFNIFFDKGPPKRAVKEVQLGSLGISKIHPDLIIPPNEIMTFRTQATFSDAISILTINPHMHLLGKSFRAYSVTGKGDTIPLIRIPNWDFRWQYFYTYSNPVVIPSGATINVEGVFDNTENNPNNPFYPPQEVREPAGSMRTTDEMFQFIFTYMPYQLGDEKISLEGATIGK